MSALQPAVAAFVRLQVEALGPYDFVSLGTPRPPLAAAQIVRTEGDTFEVRLPLQDGAQPIDVALRPKLVEAGFRSADPADGAQPWMRTASGVDDAVSTAVALLTDVLGGSVDTTLDVLHGSLLALHEAEQRLVELRARLEPMLAGLLGGAPPVDTDGDYVFQVGPVRVIVVPRAIPGALAVVRVVTITNTDVKIDADLGLFLARLNFGLMFGRFALDVEHRAIWFDETLLGDDLSETQLRFTVEMVARTAAEWRPRLQQMFGGAVDDATAPADAGSEPAGARPKPGAGGYL